VATHCEALFNLYEELENPVIKALVGAVKEPVSASAKAAAMETSFYVYDRANIYT